MDSMMLRAYHELVEIRPQGDGDHGKNVAAVNCDRQTSGLPHCLGCLLPGYGSNMEHKSHLDQHEQFDNKSSGSIHSTCFLEQQHRERGLIPRNPLVLGAMCMLMMSHGSRNLRRNSGNSWLLSRSQRKRCLQARVLGQG